MKKIICGFIFLLISLPGFSQDHKICKAKMINLHYQEPSGEVFINQEKKHVTLIHNDGTSDVFKKVIMTKSQLAKGSFAFDNFITIMELAGIDTSDVDELTLVALKLPMGTLNLIQVFENKAPSLKFVSDSGGNIFGECK